MFVFTICRCIFTDTPSSGSTTVNISSSVNPLNGGESLDSPVLISFIDYLNANLTFKWRSLFSILVSGLGTRFRCLSAATAGLINLWWQIYSSTIPFSLCTMSQWVFVTAGSSWENAHTMHVLKMYLNFSGACLLLWRNKPLMSSKLKRQIVHLNVISCLGLWASRSLFIFYLWSLT